MLQAESIFSAGSTSRLIFKFSAPAIISLLVNSFYNIVDQYFIGQGVGFYGNAATNVVFPLVSFAVAVAALIGDGAAAYFNLSLGRGEKRAAVSCVVTASFLSCVAGVAILITGQTATRPLLLMLAATPATFLMAEQYLRIILWGVPFMISGTVLAGLIRADGSPRYAMFCMLPGCIINVVLDAVFVLSCHWGVAGAAWATVIGQIANCAIAVVYLPRFQTVSLLSRWGFFCVQTAGKFLSLGAAGFINQFCGSFYMIFMNQYLAKYGALSVYGPDIPLATFGIVMKVNTIAMSFVNGIAVGVQPILGYNYGRRDYARVKECLKEAVAFVSLCSVIFFIVFQIFPSYIIGFFGQESDLYNDFAVSCFRIFLLAVPIYGFSIVSTGLFLAIGKPIQATFMALSRQVIYMIPLVVALAPHFGVVGLMYASPIGDIFAFITCLILFKKELGKLNGGRQR